MFQLFASEVYKALKSRSNEGDEGQYFSMQIILHRSHDPVM